MLRVLEFTFTCLRKRVEVLGIAGLESPRLGESSLNLGVWGMYELLIELFYKQLRNMNVKYFHGHLVKAAT
jgi:hypothetical protein